MEILAHYSNLKQCAEDLRTLSGKTVNIDNNLCESMGYVKDREEELLLLLGEAAQDLSILFQDSAILLEDIADSFRQADTSASQGFH